MIDDSVKVPLTRLVVRRGEAQERLIQQIERGRQLQETPVATGKDLATMRDWRDSWMSYTTALLRQLFATTEPAGFFAVIPRQVPILPQIFPWKYRVRDFREDMGYNIDRLEQLLYHLDLMEETPETNGRNAHEPVDGRTADLVSDGNVRVTMPLKLCVSRIEARHKLETVLSKTKGVSLIIRASLLRADGLEARNHRTYIKELLTSLFKDDEAFKEWERGCENCQYYSQMLANTNAYLAQLLDRVDFAEEVLSMVSGSSEQAMHAQDDSSGPGAPRNRAMEATPPPTAPTPLRLFVASSTEGLDVAYAVQHNLEHNLEVTVWPQGVFEPSKSSLESLIKALDSFDAAVFVFTPDDIVTMRGAEHHAVRDNVIFESGLFIGRLGRERCFFLTPHTGQPFQLPSDLIGVNPLTYNATRSDDNLRAATGPACQEIRTVFKRT